MTVTFKGTQGELTETGLTRIRYNLTTKRTVYSLLQVQERTDVFLVMDRSNRVVGEMQIRDGIAIEIFHGEVYR